MFLKVLDSLQSTDSFINATADWKIVDDSVTNNTFGIDEEESTIGESRCFFEYTEAVSDVFVEVRNNWDLKYAKSGLSSLANH